MANNIDAIAAIFFLNDAAVIKDLKNELPRYLAKADGIAPVAVDPVGWWKNNADELPFWPAAAKLVLLLQP